MKIISIASATGHFAILRDTATKKHKAFPISCFALVEWEERGQTEQEVVPMFVINQCIPELPTIARDSATLDVTIHHPKYGVVVDIYMNSNGVAIGEELRVVEEFYDENQA